MNLTNAIERLRGVLRRQHKALATDSTCVYWLRHYVTALNTMPAMLSSEQKFERFLTDLARRRDLSASSQNQALNAVLFFFKEVLRQPLQGVDALRAKRPARLRHPDRNSTKFFATETLEQFRRDEKWLARASDAIASYWRERNARKQKARGRA